MNPNPGTIECLQPAHFEALWQVFDSVARERRYLASTEAAPKPAMLGYLQGYIDQGLPYTVALVDGVVCGWCSIQSVYGQTRAHVGMLGMGLLPAQRGLGLGQRLMAPAIDAAWAFGFSRIELSVRTDNPRAIALYERMGFVREGLQRQAFYVDGDYADIATMALLRATAAA